MRDNFTQPSIRLAPIFILALAVLFCFAPDTRAAAQEEKGALSGTVMDVNDKPKAGVVLRLEMDIPKSVGGRGAGRRGKGEESVKVVGRATTDQQGKFTMANVPAGVYRLVGGNKSIGWILREVKVVANQDTKLDDLKLAKTD